MGKCFLVLPIGVIFHAWQYYQWGKDLFKAVYHWACDTLPVGEIVIAGCLIGLAIGISVVGIGFVIGKKGLLWGAALMFAGLLLFSAVSQAGRHALSLECSLAFVCCCAVFGMFRLIASRLLSRGDEAN